MVADEDGIVTGVAAPEEGALDGCAGGAADDDATAVEDLFEGLVGEGIQIGVGDAPLAGPEGLTVTGWV